MTVVELMATLNEEDFETIESMAMLNAGPRDIARKLAVDLRAFMLAWNTHNNAVRNAYYKGVQELQLVRDAALIDKVREGNMTAVQTVDRDALVQRFQDIKSEVFGLTE
jgi:hypothetical protein